VAVDPAWIALGTTLAGGIGLKFAEHYLGRSKLKVDDATRIREELRMEIDGQRQEIRELEAGLDRWRGEYYDLRDKYTQLQTELMLALAKIKKEADAQKPPEPE
jgi:predicted nuclease with TOPRIM domain